MNNRHHSEYRPKLAQMSDSDEWTEQDSEAEFEAENQGGEAFKNGVPLHANPYAARPLFEAWNEGWMNAERIALGLSTPDS